jgi:hypothetical protein
MLRRYRTSYLNPPCTKLKGCAVTNKKFYKIAADEFVSGAVDHALWTKVEADLPGLNAEIRNAKYIQLRAQELAIENIKRSAMRFVPKTGAQWCSYLVASFVVAAIADTPFESYSHPRNADFVGFGVFFSLIALPFVLKTICTRD